MIYSNDSISFLLSTIYLFKFDDLYEIVGILLQFKLNNQSSFTGVMEPTTKTDNKRKQSCWNIPMIFDDNKS